MQLFHYCSTFVKPILFLIQLIHIVSFMEMILKIDGWHVQKMNSFNSHELKSATLKQRTICFNCTLYFRTSTMNNCAKAKEKKKPWLTDDAQIQLKRNSGLSIDFILLELNSFLLFNHSTVVYSMMCVRIYLDSLAS